MDNESFINGLIALKNSPGFASLEFLINDKLEAARSALESDNRLTDFNMVCLLRGEAAAWRFLQQMFGPSLEEIKKMQELDKTNGNPAGQ